MIPNALSSSIVNPNEEELNVSSPTTDTSGKEPIKHMLIGSPKAIRATIHYLHVVNYAQTADWSPLLPTPNPGEFMSIFTRNISVQ
ncbi:hypothetical protein ICL16_42970 [Iningainema sp. BLCCT55]|uniref:Uncharacterized protein n=1 Tax=Iningainema tapete BLCC-T55 TaxID=2748662 RepID=A0A8J7C9X7_9CYAN|nr:hypothetical protein [Iningainema tapete BLCC-T55]